MSSNLLVGAALALTTSLAASGLSPAAAPQDEVDWVRVEIPRLMAGVADLKVPLLAEIGFGPNWDKAH